MPFLDPDSDLQVLNTWASGIVALTERRGTLPSGNQRKPRYAIDIKSEPLLLDLDGFNLGNGIAETWKERIQDQIRGIADRASEATQAYRARAAKAFTEGKAWALKRYAGGRLGAKPPNQTTALFNDSGRLADSIFVRPNQTDGSYTLNVAANRFNPSLFGQGYDAMIRRFAQLVPILDPNRAFGDAKIEKAIKEGLSEMLSKAEERSEAAIARKMAQLRAAKLRALRATLELARALAGG